MGAGPYVSVFTGISWVSNALSGKADGLWDGQGLCVGVFGVGHVIDDLLLAQLVDGGFTTIKQLETILGQEAVEGKGVSSFIIMSSTFNLFLFWFCVLGA